MHLIARQSSGTNAPAPEEGSERGEGDRGREGEEFLLNDDRAKLTRTRELKSGPWRGSSGRRLGGDDDALILKRAEGAEAARPPRLLLLLPPKQRDDNGGREGIKESGESRSLARRLRKTLCHFFSFFLPHFSLSLSAPPPSSLDRRGNAKPKPLPGPPLSVSLGEQELERQAAPGAFAPQSFFRFFVFVRAPRFAISIFSLRQARSLRLLILLLRPLPRPQNATE